MLCRTRQSHRSILPLRLGRCERACKPVVDQLENRRLLSTNYRRCTLTAMAAGLRKVSVSTNVRRRTPASNLLATRWLHKNFQPRGDSVFSC